MLHGMGARKMASGDQGQRGHRERPEFSRVPDKDIGNLSLIQH